MNALPRPLALLAAGFLLLACSAGDDAGPSTLASVKEAGVLKVASVYGRTTCYTGPSGLVGFECELAQGIAASIGVKAEVIFVPTPADAVQEVVDGRAHLAAAALTRYIAQNDQLLFSQPVDRSAPQLVFRMGSPRPKAPSDLNGRLLVSEGAGHAPRLAVLSAAAPGLKAGITNSADAEDLLYQVASGELDYTIAGSSLIAINERYYPQLRTAFDVGEPEDVVLAFKNQTDHSLYNAAEAYLAGISGKALARLHDRYYGHVEELDYFSTVQVANHMRSRLPRYQQMFESSGKRHDIDWRLLAAIGYQESHWNPEATSYTGVRGIMMLTSDTAARYKVSDRIDPQQSIEGGARVLSDLLASIPPEVPEPDRTWMALAAYNQGLGHLLDARALTAQRGGDPLHWVDVRDTYPLLSRARWAQKVRYGGARGREAVDFVSNVRAYFDIITMLSSGVRILPPPLLRIDSQLRTAKLDAGADEMLEDAPMPPTQLETDESLNSLGRLGAKATFGEEPEPTKSAPVSASPAALPAVAENDSDETSTGHLAH